MMKIKYLFLSCVLNIQLFMYFTNIILSCAVITEDMGNEVVTSYRRVHNRE